MIEIDITTSSNVANLEADNVQYWSQAAALDDDAEMINYVLMHAQKACLSTVHVLASIIKHHE